MGQHHAAAVAGEECDLQLLLQHADLPAEGGLHDAQPVGGFAEAAQLRHLHKGRELAQVHASYLISAWFSESNIIIPSRLCQALDPSVADGGEERVSQWLRMDAGTTRPGWQRDVFDILKAAKVRHIVYVPDAGHATAIRLAEADDEIEAVVLTTEEEGIGYLAGAWLGGERGALLMQSSGVGNCINTLALQACIALSAADGRDDARRLGRVQPGRTRWARRLKPRCG
jgi:hypothetical protein